MSESSASASPKVSSSVTSGQENHSSCNDEISDTALSSCSTTSHACEESAQNVETQELEKNASARAQQRDVTRAVKFVLEGIETECSVNVAPRLMKRELESILRAAIENRDLDPKELVVVPTIQKTKMGILDWNEEVAKEKDDCLERFERFARKLCSELERRGFWADFADPCSGLPMLSGGNTVYSEVHGLSKIRGFPTANAGGCRIALHPEWGDKMYPATIFTIAPVDVVKAEVEKLTFSMASPPQPLESSPSLASSVSSVSTRNADSSFSQ